MGDLPSPPADSPQALRAQVLRLRRRVDQLRQAEDRLRRAGEELGRRRRRGGSLSGGGGPVWWDTDLEAGRGRFSAGLYELLGRPDPGGEIALPKALELVHPEDRGMLEEILAGRLDGSAAYQAEFRLSRADGGWMWFSAQGRVISRDPDGRPRRFLGFLQDITAQRAALAELDDGRSLAEDRYRLAADLAGAGAWRWDLLQDTLLVEPEFSRRLGFGGGGEYGDIAPWLEQVPARDREKALAAARDCIEGREPWFEASYRLRDAEGRTRWFVARGHAETDGAGRAVALSGVSWEVTELRRAEGALAAKEAELMAQAASLAEANTALKVLLEKRQEALERHRARTRRDLERRIRPYLEMLAQADLPPREAGLVAILQGNLEEMARQGEKEENPLRRLSPAERQVAELVRRGLTSKEIGRLMGVSASAVQFHREAIRRKLRLRHTRRNLRVHLQKLFGHPESGPEPGPGRLKQTD